MKFNPDNKAELTFEECLEPAMNIEIRYDALIYLRDYKEYIKKRSPTVEITDDEAENTAKINLGYYAGYYNNSVRERVEHLFDCEHPYFGSFAEFGSPTANEAFTIGKTSKTLKQIRDGY